MPKEQFSGNQDVADWDILGDRYAVEIMEVGDIKHGDVILPDQGEMKRGWACGRIVAIGNGHRLERDEKIPMFYSVGDVIIFERLTGKDFRVSGKEIRIMSQIDVLARVP